MKTQLAINFTELLTLQELSESKNEHVETKEP